MKKILIHILVIGLLAGCSLREESEPEVKEVTPEPTVEQLRTDLFEAVLEEDFRSVENMIKKGVNLEGYDQQGHTVLMRAVQLRSSIMVNILIEAGAKIFAPMENDPNETAIKKVHQIDEEIINLFNKEKERLAKKLTSYVENDSYKEAQAFIINNFIPFSFEIEENLRLSSYVISSIEGVDNGEIELVKYMFDGREHEKLSPYEYKGQIVSLATRIKNKAFFDYCVDKLKSYSNIGQSLVIAEDSTDTDWFTYKLSILRKYNVAVEANHLMSLQPTISISTKENFSSLHRELLFFIDTDYEKNRHIKNFIEVIISKSKEDNNYLSWVSSFITMWSKQNIEKTGYSIDELMVSILSSVNMIDYDFSLVQEITKKLLGFTENRDTIQTFNHIFSSGHTNSQKVELVELVLSYADKLPNGVFALAAKSDTVLLLNKLIESNLPFNASEQSNSILAALENTSSGDVAKSILLILKEKNIPFDTDEGAKALMFAYRKMWQDNDKTYSKVVDFLLSTSPSPINNLRDNEKVDLLGQHLRFILRGEKNLSDLEHILQRINPPISESIIYTKYYFPLGSGSHQVQLSFVWDYIISMYDYIQDNPEKLSQSLSVLNRIIKKFPKEKTAMTFHSNNMVLERNIITRQILPLTLMLSQQKEDFHEAVFEVSGHPSASMYSTQVSLTGFYSGLFYENYSENKEYWENITSILLANGHTVPSINHPSYSYFINSLFESKAFSKFPELSDRIGYDNMVLHKTHKECVFKERDYTELYQENQFDNVNGWTTLGSFEALTALAKRTCAGEDVTGGEINYVKSFINNNLEVPKSTNNGSYPFSPSHYRIYETPYGTFRAFTFTKKVKCRDYRNENRGPYSRERTPLGVAYKRIISDESESDSFSIPDIMSMDEISILGEDCWHYEYSQERHNLAKIAFLNNWLKCAVDNNKSNVISMFESLNSDFNITASDGDFGIKLCKL